MSVLVSVIIPTYNRKNDLEKAIVSVLSQTFTNFELLVCDDGSTDGSEELVASFSQKDARVKWISSLGIHAGRPAIPRNHGIKAAAGEWLAFLDSDDIWLPHKLESQLQKAEQFKAVALCSNSFLDETKTSFFTCASAFLKVSDLLHDNRVICSSVLIKKSCLYFGFPENKNLKAYEDYVCWLKVVLNNDFYYDATPMLRYTTSNISSIRRDLWFQNFYKKLLSHLEFSVFAYKTKKQIYPCLIMKETLINIKRALGDFLRSL